MGILNFGVFCTESGPISHEDDDDAAGGQVD